MALHVYLKRIVEQHEILSRDDARALLDEILVSDSPADTHASLNAMQLAAFEVEFGVSRFFLDEFRRDRNLLEKISVRHQFRRH